MTNGFSMLAMTLTSPPHSLQVSMSIPNTHFNLCAQVIEARFSTEQAESCYTVLANANFRLAQQSGRLVGVKFIKVLRRPIESAAKNGYHRVFISSM